MVFGDSMADWLGYGLEQAFTDTPEIGILRRHRTSSGLIRTEVKGDPRGEYPDWPQAAREMIAAQRPKFVVMMIGLNDRRQIKEATQPVRAKPAAPANSSANDPAAQELDVVEPVAAASPEVPASRGTKTFEFRSDAWSEAYIRRIDDTIGALKTAGVPIFWVGLPPLRSGRAASDVPFLNDLYRSRADKAGIVYVDVWDGFVDEDGRFVQSGLDFDGQTRRLRTGDGVYFTQAGARKLAHFVEREIDRWLARANTVALPVEEPKAAAPETPEVAPGAAPGKAGPSKARPLSGPVVPLISGVSSESEQLLGGTSPPAVTDAVAMKVLVKGEAMPVPAGRADDFAWPRRTVAPLGSDPVVATTDLPMTPMVAERGSAPAEATAVAAAALAAPQPPRRVRAAEYQPRQQFNFFSFLFGGGR